MFYRRTDVDTFNGANKLFVKSVVTNQIARYNTLVSTKQKIILYSEGKQAYSLLHQVNIFLVKSTKQFIFLSVHLLFCIFFIIKRTRSEFETSSRMAAPTNNLSHLSTHHLFLCSLLNLLSSAASVIVFFKCARLHSSRR